MYADCGAAELHALFAAAALIAVEIERSFGLDVFKQYAGTARNNNRRLVRGKLLFKNTLALCKVIRVYDLNPVYADRTAERLKVYLACRVALYVVAGCRVLLMTRHAGY